MSDITSRYTIVNEHVIKNQNYNIVVGNNYLSKCE